MGPVLDVRHDMTFPWWSVLWVDFNQRRKNRFNHIIGLFPIYAGTVRGFMNTTEGEIEHLRGDIKKLRTDIEHLGATLGRVARAGACEVGEAVCDATQDFRATFRQTADGATSTVEDNPFPAALAALGIGILLGRLCSGRRC